MRRSSWLLLSCALFLSGCLTVHHTAGVGPTGGEVREAHVWYALWGFLPLGGTPDVRDLAGRDRLNYRVTTGMDTWDVLLNLPLLPLGFLRLSVQVEL